MEPRKFISVDAKTSNAPNPLMVGITAPSFGGKTFSALRLAKGMQKVTGGKVYLLDTEKNRSLHYKRDFDFVQVPFLPPYNPESYAEGIQHCLNEGAKVIIVDQMSYEHSGEGGVLDMIEAFLDAKAGDDYRRRESLKFPAMVAPKAERKRLNNMIRGIGADAILIFLFRANDKTKPGKTGEKPVHLGWQAETTSDLPYDMTVRFLLPPASDGRPNLSPDTEFEKLSIKMPGAFRDWFKPGLQLNEELGEKLARWSLDSSSVAEPSKPKATIDSAFDATCELIGSADVVLNKLNLQTRDQLTEEHRAKLSEIYSAAKKAAKLSGA